MIPMGTVMAVCMLLGAMGIAMVPILPRVLVIALGSLLLAAGLWNAVWYGLQHFNAFWGQMAFWSGIAMLVSSFVCFRLNRPGFMDKVKPLLPVLALLLLGFGGYYGWTIYNL